MKRVLASLIGLLLLVAAPGAWAALLETPYFVDAVTSGKLPPVVQRIPRDPGSPNWKASADPAATCAC